LDSPLVIADLTNHNPNVFYELGIRHSIGKPIIQLIKRGQKIPFDLAAIRTIEFELTDPDSVEETIDIIKRQIKEIHDGNFKMETPLSLISLQTKQKSEIEEMKELLAQLIKMQNFRLHEQGIKNNRILNDDIEITEDFLNEIESRDEEIEKLRLQIGEVSPVTARDLENVMNKANSYFFAEKYYQSIKLYDVVLEKDPSNINALHNKGFVLTKINRINDALTLYEKILEKHPDDVFTLVNIGIALHELKQFDKAILYFDKVLKRDPDNVFALVNKGYALHYLKQFNESLQCYDKALKINPDDIEALNNKGWVLVSLKKYDEAIEYFDKALILQPKYSLAITNKGQSMLSLKKYDEAIECFDKVIELEPDNMTAITSRNVAIYNKDKLN